MGLVRVGDREMGSGSLHMVMDSCEDMRGHMGIGVMGAFYLRHNNKCYHKHTVHTPQQRNSCSCLKWAWLMSSRIKLFPVMIHDYTCLQSCAREVFTAPDASRWQSHGLLPYLSLNAVPAKWPNVSIRSWCSHMNHWVDKALGTATPKAGSFLHWIFIIHIICFSNCLKFCNYQWNIKA